ncbi:hypothetical protein HanPSC8_Chr01g0034251 [Helianthus annuus]|nr:hypothetical protein HanPSC8_Chr01g0034251 [Helianthus annuus]
MVCVSGLKSSSESAIFTLFSAIHHVATMSRLATLFAIAVAMAAIDNYASDFGKKEFGSNHQNRTVKPSYQ